MATRDREAEAAINIGDLPAGDPMHSRRTFALHAAALMCAAAAAAPVSAQPMRFPSRPITVLVPFGPGAGGDQHMRQLASAVSDELGVPVIVNNLPGANGAVAFNALRNTPPDGHTLMMTSSTTQIINPLLMRKPPFDPAKDLAPVGGLLRTTQILVVRGDSDFRDVSTLVARAKGASRPLTYASPTSAARLGTELFALLAGVKLLHVPYKATPAAVTDLLGGQVDLMFLDPPTAVPMIEAGKLRALAVGSARRHRRLPDVPTLAEAGIRDYEFSGWTAVHVLPHTPADAVAKLHEAFQKANSSPALEKFLSLIDAERFDASPAQLARIEASELVAWKARAATLGIQPE